MTVGRVRQLKGLSLSGVSSFFQDLGSRVSRHRVHMLKAYATLWHTPLKSSSSRRRGRRLLLVVSAIDVDIVSASRKMSTKPDQTQPGVTSGTNHPGLLESWTP